MLQKVLFTLTLCLNGSFQNDFYEKPEDDEDNGIFCFSGLKELLASEELEKEINKKKKKLVTIRRGQDIHGDLNLSKSSKRRRE